VMIPGVIPFLGVSPMLGDDSCSMRLEVPKMYSCCRGELNVKLNLNSMDCSCRSIWWL
jgi:hypothetical protein